MENSPKNRAVFMPRGCLASQAMVHGDHKNRGGNRRSKLQQILKDERRGILERKPGENCLIHQRGGADPAKGDDQGDELPKPR